MSHVKKTPCWGQIWVFCPFRIKSPYLDMRKGSILQPITFSESLSTSTGIRFHSPYRTTISIQLWVPSFMRTIKECEMIGFQYFWRVKWLMHLLHDGCHLFWRENEQHDRNQGIGIRQLKINCAIASLVYNGGQGIGQAASWYYNGV